MDWKQAATALSPLLAYTDRESATGEGGILDEIFRRVPEAGRFAVEFGQRSTTGATVSGLLRKRGWSALFMDLQAPEKPTEQVLDNGARIRLAREQIGPSNLSALFERHAVPADLDCLVIDIDGLDYWAWSALDERYRPSLVVAEFNAHVDPRVQATLRPDPDWRYVRTRDYGASYAALCALARRKGYRLIHVHGCWNLHFLRADIPWPAELGVKQPLTVEEFRLLTDTEPAFDQLHRAKGRPTWFAAAPPDVSRPPWQLLPDEVPRQRVRLYELEFEVLGAGHDPVWYQQRKTYEERQSLLYPLLAAEGFERFVDIGANVGLVSMLARRAHPALKVLAIEADPRLAALARRNFAAHGLDDVVLVNAAAGDRDLPAASFALNPGSSLDNRVKHTAWPTVHVPMHRLDGLLARTGFDQGRTFFKVDTQGFELQVLRGLEGLLIARDDWLLKMEFAPDWLRSQGTDPLLLLDHLMLRYEVAEYPERIPFGTPSTDALFASPLRVAEQHRFLEHVQALNGRGLGWVDLVLRPRPR